MGRRKFTAKNQNATAYKKSWREMPFKAFLLSICLIGVLIFSICFVFGMENEAVGLNVEEKTWLTENKEKTFVLGLDPEGGIESFPYNEGRVGYIYDFAKDITKDIGLKIKVVDNLSWNASMEGLKDKKIDIVLGANRTKEREAYMLFTKSMRDVPYVVFAKKDSRILNIGDISGKFVAFLKGDSVVHRLKEHYSRLDYMPYYFEKNNEGMDALLKGKVEAVIIAGGEVTYEYLRDYPQIKKVCNIERVQSAMTLSTLQENRILQGILDKYIVYEGNTGRLSSMIKSAMRAYIRKLLNLTKEELEWLKFDGKVVFGVTKDYLPFDCLENGEYKGINGAICADLTDLMGFRPTYKSGDFATLLNLLTRRDIDVLCVAKTDEREKEMFFTIPYINDRDRIYGKIETPSVFDITGLKGKKVAVINGYYQIDMLEKNNIGAELIRFDDIEQCIKAVHTGKAEYLIENEQVLNYYSSELGIYDILEKGITSADTRLYFGINKSKPELVSILNKVIPLINIEGAVEKGLETVPRKKNFERYKSLLFAVSGLTLLLCAIGLLLYYLFHQLLKEKTQKEVLIQREELLYRDSLTGVYNRNYYNDKIRPFMDQMKFPQAILVFDLNNLKDINDSYGHDVGDKVLEAFGNTLTEHNENQIGVRIGGDEFVVFLFGERAGSAGELVEELCQNAEAAANALSDIEALKFGCAKGYSVRIDNSISLDELFRRADKKMYEDKSNKRS